MSVATIRVLERIAFAVFLGSAVLVAVIALEWGPTVLYIAVPYFAASLIIIGVRLWARSVGGLPTLSRNGSQWDEYWDDVEGRKSRQ